MAYLHRPCLTVMILWALGLGVLGSSGLSQAQPTPAAHDWLGMENVSERYSAEPIVELWYYHQKMATGAFSNMATLRYYQPIHNPFNQWRGMIRFDQSYFNSFGPTYDSPESNRYQRGNTMMTIWGNHPGLFPNWHGDLGFRVVFPVGNQGQWAVGPQAGVSYQTRKPEGQMGLADFSPLVRIMFGFNIKGNPLTTADQPPPERLVQFFPALGFDLSPNTQVRLWDENGLAFSPTGSRWFVPLDAMLTHKVTKNLVMAIGASKSVVSTYPQYNWSVYGKVAWYF
jgi:hypothetical protein